MKINQILEQEVEYMFDRGNEILSKTGKMQPIFSVLLTDAEGKKGAVNVSIQGDTQSKEYIKTIIELAVTLGIFKNTDKIKSVDYFLNTSEVFFAQMEGTSEEMMDRMALDENGKIKKNLRREGLFCVGIGIEEEGQSIKMKEIQRIEVGGMVKFILSNIPELEKLTKEEKLSMSMNGKIPEIFEKAYKQTVKDNIKYSVESSTFKDILTKNN